MYIYIYICIYVCVYSFCVVVPVFVSQFYVIGSEQYNMVNQERN